MDLSPMVDLHPARHLEQVFKTPTHPLRQVFLNLDQGPLYRALETLYARRTMAFHHNALQTEKTRTVMPRRCQIRPESPEQRQCQHADGFRCQVAPEQ